ncbi:hypothetical protein K505DRAFT_422586 [Melanomma pulvis-pyrius CBS 109.77]|uniref:Mediator of RNA polymerase II transcription subunit 8 n=1 Tax=Melanomma pulvis-pyrius CBS 109.77 TaxID=1314802 RepID=A0A6A6WQS3_9PLEO|nr:hypothetical protein K505DRAFT_422586 [Melanomma pulvis-pyrius CBS 109.77]
MSRPATQKLTSEDITVLEGLRARMMPLRYNIENLQREMMFNQGNPPSWPEIQRATAVLNSHIHSIQQYINGFSVEVMENNQSTTKVTPGQHPILRSLHPYPTPPFSFEQNGMGGLVETLLRKKPGPKEEKWVIDRLQKASEFCYVPADWGIEPRKGADGVADVDDEGGNDDDGEGANIKVKKVERRDGKLSEDELIDIWMDASNQAQIAAEKIADEQLALGDDDGSSESSSQNEDEEMGDAEQPPSTNGAGPSGAGAAAAAARPTALPLNAILKFMGTGSTE